MQERRREKFATEMMQKEDRRSRAVERHLREEMRRGLPKCGHPTRSGEPCPNPKPCAVHELAPGMRWCQSTLDKNPCEGCRMQCPADKQYCEYHVDFPDLGLQAAKYFKKCKAEGAPVTKEGLVKWAYPGATKVPDIHNVEVYCGSVLKQISHHLGFVAQNALQVVVQQEGGSISAGVKKSKRLISKGVPSRWLSFPQDNLLDTLAVVCKTTAEESTKYDEARRFAKKLNDECWPSVIYTGSWVLEDYVSEPDIGARGFSQWIFVGYEDEVEQYFEDWEAYVGEWLAQSEA